MSLIDYSLLKNNLDNFIETGTYHGDTTLKMVNIGFKYVYTVEYYEPFYNDCVNKFKDIDNIKLFQGVSYEKFPEMLKDINSSSVFFLDAHPSGHNTGGHDELINSEYKEECSFHQDNIISNELIAISKHHVKDHIIIIDDQHGYHKNTKKFIDTININNNYSYFFMDDLRGDEIIKDMQLILCPDKYKHLFNL
jgi:hypothetical protein